MTTLITGATGFIGSAVVRALSDAGHQVRALVRPTSDLRNLKGLRIDVAEGDLTDRLATSSARAVFFSALTTIVGFGNLAFAPHQGMASMGKLLALGVAFTLVCTLVVLPALLATGRTGAVSEPTSL